jgi:hypothetical protein
MDCRYSWQQDDPIYQLVMPGLVPSIHVFLYEERKQVVDGRNKPGHDES